MSDVTARQAREGRVSRLGTRADLALLTVVLLVAIAVRIGFVARSKGGFSGNFGYDSSVYYAASDALLHGRLPYRDFTLLHPPALMLALTPFAALGRLTTDHVGFVVGNVGMAVVGAVNAALVSLVTLRLHAGRAAALLGGIGYAVWYSAFVAEFSIRLEPLGNLFTLLGLLALATGRQGHHPRRTALAGAAFGVAAAVKIWWLAPLAVVVVWTLIDTRSWRRAGTLAAGATAALVLVYGPFLVAAPRAMTHMVLLDQLGRPSANDTVTSRLSTISGVTTIWPPSHRVAQLLAACVVLLVVAAAVLAWRVAAARLAVVLMVTTLVVLVAGPSLAFYYTDFFAAPTCVSAAVAAGVALALARERQRAWLTAATTGLVCVPLLVVGAGSAALLRQHTGISTPFPRHRLQAAAAKVRCVVADSPMALIELDVLSRGLSNGCPNWIDVTGRTYGIDRARTVDGHRAPRVRNARWQRDLRRYLTSGDAVLTIRRDTGMDGTTVRAVRRGDVIASEGGVTLYRTAP